MACVKRPINAKKKHRTVLKQASGYCGQRSRMYRKAKEQVTHSFVYPHRGRKAKKGDSHRLQIQRIDVTSHVQGLTYNRPVQGLNLVGVEVDRRMLAELAVGDISTFSVLVKVAKDALPTNINVPKAWQVSFSVERLMVLDNPRADRMRRVSGPVGYSARPRPGLVLVEEPQAICGLTVHRPDVVHDVCVRGDAWGTHVDVMDVAWCTARWMHPVTAEVPAVLSGDSQGICAVAPLDTSSRELPEPSAGETIVVLARGRDPGNIGTIIRTADAFGAIGAVAVAGMVDAASLKVMRSDAGSVFRIPVRVVPSSADARVSIHNRSTALLGISGGTASINLSDLLIQGVSVRSRLFQSRAWAFGNEARGLPGDEMCLYDGFVSILMTGDAESLNVASAAATYLLASQIVQGVKN